MPGSFVKFSLVIAGISFAWSLAGCSPLDQDLASPNSVDLDFGLMLVGQAKTLPIDVPNNSTKRKRLAGISHSCSCTSVEGWEEDEIAAMRTAKFAVTLSPGETPGRRTSNILFRFNEKEEGVFRVHASATVVRPLSPAKDHWVLDLRKQHGDAPLTLVVNNFSDAKLEELAFASLPEWLSLSSCELTRDLASFPSSKTGCKATQVFLVTANVLIDKLPSRVSCSSFFTILCDGDTGFRTIVPVTAVLPADCRVAPSELWFGSVTGGVEIQKSVFVSVQDSSALPRVKASVEKGECFQVESIAYSGKTSRITVKTKLRAAEKRVIVEDVLRISLDGNTIAEIPLSMRLN